MQKNSFICKGSYCFNRVSSELCGCEKHSMIVLGPESLRENDQYQGALLVSWTELCRFPDPLHRVGS